MLVSILSRVTVIVALLLAIAIWQVIGFGTLFQALRNWRPRVRAALPVTLALVPVLIVNKLARQDLVTISQEYGFRVGDLFYVIEGRFILVFETIASTQLTQYFSFIYIYGYVFLLIFPVVMYFTLQDSTKLRRLLGAYALNYTIGVTLYVLFHAFGPRQYFGSDVETMLYTFEPSYQLLTREINHYTNVFPSLHTSLSATVMIFAIRSRSQFPAWTPAASVLAVSVWLSTMYLGIHWAIDVLGGLLLAGTCVWLSCRLIGRYDVDSHLQPAYDRLGAVADRVRATGDSADERRHR
ncbi:phosphoesterase PA-phosphatase-related protein [Halovivax asiaticus JCM 14624]|uniref:Phosphoesterase PA-phosphatase-related protein n=1 Tax=Halovivax asiaticus JCM 14624 TaxID=1227490 RepID=M0BQG4_9EURY|nr:phosphatase PAP2 family protein [Halovivax asiaticus]ELZ12588.1 phosphoesterase PA-phosphatase-related protein [Halovivax asiaticus JCM 14624]